MKNFIIPLIIALIIIGSIIFYYSGRNTSATDDQLDSSSNQSEKTEQTIAPTDNVKIEDGKQIIEITVWGGYSPRQTVAKADVSTIIRVKTNKTFDCSSSLIIPTLRIQKSLPQSGTTDIEIPAQKSNSSLRALCAMGMYYFEIEFN